MNYKNQLVQNTAIIAIGNLGTKIVSFLLLRLYTAKLTTAEYGIYDFLVTLEVFLLPIVTLMMEESMFRYLIDAENDKEKKSIVTSTVLYITLSGIAFTIITTIIMLLMHYEYVFIFVLFVISNLLIVLSNCLARGTSRIKLYALSNFILGAVTILLNILLITVFDFGVYGLLWGNILANIFTAIVMLKKLGLSEYVGKKYISKKTLKSMIKYSIPLVPNSISWLVITMSDRVMLTTMVGESQNGIYSVANRFPNILYTCYNFFAMAWKESAARIVKEENKAKQYNSIFKDTKSFLKAVTLGLIAVMPFAFPVLIDKGYNEAYIYIPILAIAIYYTCLSSFFGGIFSAYKDTKIMGNTTIVSAIINVGINFIFLNIFEIYAAAFSTLIANVVVYIYRFIKLRKYVKLDYKIDFIYCILLGITLVTYYINNMAINVIMFLIVLLYCISINKDVIKMLLNKVKNRNKKETQTV